MQQGDVALLFRALTNVEYYEEALRRYGIDYYLVGGHAFYAQQEIYDLLNLLRAIDSRLRRSEPGRRAAQSRCSAFSTRRCSGFRKRKGWPRGFLPRTCPRNWMASSGSRPSTPRPRSAQLRAMKDRLPVAQLIHEALDRTGYDALLLAEFLGERKLANLHKLIEQARSFDRAGIFTLSDFITQLSRVRRPATRRTAGRHASGIDRRGEADVDPSVEGAGVSGGDRAGRGPAAAADRPAGGLYAGAWPDVQGPEATTGYDLLMMAENEEDLAELSRLLYVATTRAADYLILSAGVEEPGKAGRAVDGIARQTLRSADAAARCVGPPALAPAGSRPGHGQATTTAGRSGRSRSIYGSGATC